MKYFFFLLIIFIASSTLYSQVIISGKISGLQKANVNKFEIFDFCNQKVIDSAIILSDTFLLKVNPFKITTIDRSFNSFSIYPSKPLIYSIQSGLNNLSAFVWVDSDEIQISGDILDMVIPKQKESELRFYRVCNNLKKTGSFNQTINDTFFHSIEKEMKEYLYITFKKYKGMGFITKEEFTVPRENLRQKMFEQAKYYVGKYPNYEASAFIIFYMTTNENIFTEVQKNELYNMLTEKCKNSSFFKLG